MSRRKKTQERAESIQVRLPSDSLEEFEGGRIEFFLHNLFMKLRDNLKEVVISLLTVIVLIGGAAIYNNWQTKRESQGIVAYEKLLDNPLMDVEARSEKEALKLLDEYAQKYTDEKSRLRSDLLRINYLVRDGQAKEAAALSVRIGDDLEFPDERLYFYIQAAIIYENSGAAAEALKYYSRAVDLSLEENFIKAFAYFGRGRTLFATGKQEEGRAEIEKLMNIKDNPQVDRLRTAAVAFLLKN